MRKLFLLLIADLVGMWLLAFGATLTINFYCKICGAFTGSESTDIEGDKDVTYRDDTELCSKRECFIAEFGYDPAEKEDEEE
jgi:hypothetical protein